MTHPRSIEALCPELLPFRKDLVGLNPRRGHPTANDSSLGGSLLWPRDEPGPTCTAEHKPLTIYLNGDEEMSPDDAVRAAGGSVTRVYVNKELKTAHFEQDIPVGQDEPGPATGVPVVRTYGDPDFRPPQMPPSPVALVPVLQLFATEFPELPFPDGTDLLQVMWCPFDHHDGENDNVWVRPQLFWRNRSACDGELAVAAPPEADESYVPRPCVLHPERLIEYPGRDLPRDMVDLMEQRLPDLDYECDLWNFVGA